MRLLFSLSASSSSVNGMVVLVNDGLVYGKSGSNFDRQSQFVEEKKVCLTVSVVSIKCVTLFESIFFPIFRVKVHLNGIVSIKIKELNYFQTNK